MFWFKSCPRCGGDLYEERDQCGSYLSCVQCGYYLTEAELLRYASRPRMSSTLPKSVEHAREAVGAGRHTNICDRHTSADAFHRGYKVVIPRDCVQALTDEDHESGLEYIKRIYGARITTSEEITRDWKSQETAASYGPEMNHYKRGVSCYTKPV